MLRISTFVSRRTACLTFLGFALQAMLCNESQAAIVIADFDELAGYNDASGTMYFDGYGATASAGSWQTKGASFNTGPFGPGWSYSRVDDPTTPGFMNQWAALPGKDFSGSGNYAIGTTFANNGAFINLPSNHLLDSMRVSNTTYSGLSMLNGDAFAKKFGGPSGNDPDFFKVVFSGFSGTDATGVSTGSVEFFLADYRFADNSLDYIVDTWELVDLTALGNARSLGISFDGSDVGGFGLNTPAYVAIDNVSLSSVPEPGSLLLLGISLGLTLPRRRRR